MSPALHPGSAFSVAQGAACQVLAAARSPGPPPKTESLLGSLQGHHLLPSDFSDFLSPPTWTEALGSVTIPGLAPPPQGQSLPSRAVPGAQGSPPAAHPQPMAWAADNFPVDETQTPLAGPVAPGEPRCWYRREARKGPTQVPREVAGPLQRALMPTKQLA